MKHPLLHSAVVVFNMFFTGHYFDVLFSFAVNPHVSNVNPLETKEIKYAINGFVCDTYRVD